MCIQIYYKIIFITRGHFLELKELKKLLLLLLLFIPLELLLLELFEMGIIWPIEFCPIEFEC